MIGPAATLARALALLDDAEGGAGRPDAALVDLNLSGDIAAPLVERLIVKGVPVLLMSGYENLNLLPEGLRQLPRLRKPVSHVALLEALSGVLRSS